VKALILALLVVSTAATVMIASASAQGKKQENKYSETSDVRP